MTGPNWEERSGLSAEETGWQWRREGKGVKEQGTYFHTIESGGGYLSRLT
jgi:hypothetical protein